MSTYAAIIDNGKTSAEGFYKAISMLLGNGGVPLITNPTALQAVQHAGGANMSVDISIGSAFVPNTLSTFGYNIWQDAVSNLSIGTASALNPRIDAVVAYINMAAVSTTNSNNPGALAFMDVQGTPASSPTAPSSSTIQAAVGAGVPWILLANVTVPQNATQIVTSNIADARPPYAVRANLWGGSNNTNGHTVPNVADDTVLLAGATQNVSHKTFDNTNVINWDGWSTPTGTFTYAGNNGQKEFLVNSSVNLTGVIQVGDKFKVARTGTTPTQCMSFTASASQYATNAAPAGITFTGAFTCEAWIYLLSYNGAAQAIVGRRDSGNNNGWWMDLTTSGQLEVAYEASGTYTTWLTYQSIPLNRWVHVAAVVSSITGKTLQGLYINGVSVSTQNTGSSAASLTQSGALAVGAIVGSSASECFNGYISEVRVWSVAQSQAQIQANMAISLTGSETNLVALFQGNGNFNDKTSNANNLTATNGASATQAANPFNAIEYGFVTNITSTQLTVFCGTQCTIPNQTLGAVAYSQARAPYGFPVGRGKWIVDALFRTQQSLASPTVGTWYNLGSTAFAIPTGEWIAQYAVSAHINATSGDNSIATTLAANSTNSETDVELTAAAEVNASVGFNTPAYRQKPISSASLMTWYLLTKVITTAGSPTIYNRGENATTVLRAECAYV